MKILLLSAYDAGSHRYWHKYLTENMSQHQWEVLTLPPRYFSWRVRGNSLTWAFHPVFERLSEYDCLIATSMVDLSSLRGMVPALCGLPTALYFHENQFAYPVSKHQNHSVEPQITSLYSAICADYLVFNSQYNRDTFLQGTESLLDRLPDCVPRGITDKLKVKSRCIAVPIHESFFSDRLQSTEGQVSRKKQLHIVWNHRWEFDKGPELLADVIECLPRGLPLVFHIVGQSFRVVPSVFEKIRRLLESREWLGEWGFIEDKKEYQALLQRADIVLSTAKHDFQGLSVLEGVAAGCVPVVPDRLVYPEWFLGEYCYPVTGVEAENIRDVLLALLESFQSKGLPHAPSVKAFSWAVLRGKYQQIISELTVVGSH